MASDFTLSPVGKTWLRFLNLKLLIWSKKIYKFNFPLYDLVLINFPSETD